MLISIHYSEIKCYLINDQISSSFTELKQMKVEPGVEVDCELFDPPLKASEIEEIGID